MSMVEVWDLVQKNRLSSSDYSLEHLHSMLSVCASQQRGQMSIEANHAILRIRDEITRRESLARHESVVGDRERQHRQIRVWVDDVLSAQTELRRSIDRIHRIDLAILIVGAIAAIAAVILLFLKR